MSVCEHSYVWPSLISMSGYQTWSFVRDRKAHPHSHTLLSTQLELQMWTDIQRSCSWEIDKHTHTPDMDIRLGQTSLTNDQVWYPDMDIRLGQTWTSDWVIRERSKSTLTLTHSLKHTARPTNVDWYPTQLFVRDSTAHTHTHSLSLSHLELQM